jgi:hypothetical protein
MFLIDAGGLFGIVLLAFWIWALVDCIASDAKAVRNLPKAMWIVLVLLLPDLGSFLWLLLGRPVRSRDKRAVDYSAPRRPIGPEDQPSYSSDETQSYAISDRRSAELDRLLAQWEMEQADKAKNEDEDTK